MSLAVGLSHHEKKRKEEEKKRRVTYFFPLIFFSMTLPVSNVPPTTAPPTLLSAIQKDVWPPTSVRPSPELLSYLTRTNSFKNSRTSLSSDIRLRSSLLFFFFLVHPFDIPSFEFHSSSLHFEPKEQENDENKDLNTTHVLSLVVVCCDFSSFFFFDCYWQQREPVKTGEEEVYVCVWCVWEGWPSSRAC